MEVEKVKILAIDDNFDNLVTIKALLREVYTDAKILTALSGSEGIKMALAEKPDVILLDIVMPDMDGYEVCRRLKSYNTLAEVPVVFVTALKGDKESRIKALEVGAEAFLAKPIDESELIAQVRSMLKIQKANEEKRNEHSRLLRLVDERTQELKATHHATLNLLEDIKNENKARKTTEEALRKSEARLLRAELASKSGNWEIHTDTGILIPSAGAAAIYELEYKPVQHEIIKSFRLPQYDDLLEKAFKELIEENKDFEVEFEIKHPITGNIKDIYSKAFYDKENKIVFGVVQDITERKQAQKTIRESEEKFRDMANLLPQVIFEMDIDGVVTYCNKQAQTMFGYSVEEVMGSVSLQFHIPEDRDRVKNNFGLKLLGVDVNSREYEMLRKDGSTFPALIYTNVIWKENTPVGLRGIVIDITETKKAEEKLRQSEEKYRFMAENSSDIIWHMGKDYCFDYVSPAIEKMQGYKPEELIGKNLFTILTPSGINKINELVIQTKNNLDHKGLTIGKQLELETVCKDGTIIWTEVSLNIHLDEHQKPVGLHGVTRDVTERKAAQDALIESESRYNAFINNNIDMIFVKDEQCRYLVANNSMANFFGKLSSELLGKTDGELADNNLIYPCKSTDLQALNAETAMVFEETLGDRIFESVKFPMQLKNGAKGIGGILRDITERKNAEGKLKYITRLYALLGQLNQAIVRIKDADELFDTICQLAIEYGQFRMCWIGIYDDADETLKPYKFAGHDDGYLKAINIKSYNPMPLGNGPSGKAMREGTMAFCNDISTDSTMDPWKDEALKRNYRSSFSTPLSRKGKVFGTLTLYASETYFFDEEERRLLQEIGIDISYALDAIDSENERKQVEKALIESEAKYREFVENSPEAIAIYTDNVVTYVNKECLKLMRAESKDQLIGMSVIDFIHPDNRQIVIERMMNVPVSEMNVSLPAVEEKYIRMDGTPIYVEVKVMPMELDGKPAVQLTARDITDRKTIEQSLEQNRQELKAIYDNAPIMMCLVNRNREVLFTNEAFQKFTEISYNKHSDNPVSNLLGGIIHCINSTENPHGCGYGVGCKNCLLRNSINESFITGVGKNNIEFNTEILIDNQKRDIILLASIALIKSHDEDDNNLLICLSDITDRKLAEDALQKSEMLLRTFIDNSPFEIWARDNESVGILENKKLTDHYGSIVGFTPQSDPRVDKDTLLMWESINSRVYNGEIIDEEYEFIIDGEPHIYQQIVFPINVNNKLIGIAGFNIDITDRKKSELALKESQEELKKFAAHLQNVREEERVLLAREIHDELGQILVAMKIDMGMLKLAISKDSDRSMSEDVQIKFNNLSKLVDNTIKTARRIMTDLRPEVLDMLGFIDTVKQHLSSFQERYHVYCNFNCSDSNLTLNSQQSVALFRIIQEALNNTAKYAKASEVDLAIQQSSDDLTMTISDNGVGFDLNSKKNLDSYGLIGMKERVFLLDGELTIKSKKGAGTIIKVKIPYQLNQQSQSVTKNQEFNANVK
jgi:PAS domain S-box-containing protein